MKNQQGGRRWRRFGSLSRNIHEGRYVEEILLCLFFRLFVCSPNYSLFSEKKWGRGKLANSIPFVFFLPFPRLIYRSVVSFTFQLSSTEFSSLFSFFLKFVETSEKSKMKILEMEGTSSNHRLIEIRGYSCDPSIFALRINRKLGRG